MWYLSFTRTDGFGICAQIGSQCKEYGKSADDREMTTYRGQAANLFFQGQVEGE
jgi:hypothetical protein